MSAEDPTDEELQRIVGDCETCFTMDEYRALYNAGRSRQRRQAVEALREFVRIGEKPSGEVTDEENNFYVALDSRFPYRGSRAEQLSSLADWLESQQYPTTPELAARHRLGVWVAAAQRRTWEEHPPDPTSSGRFAGMWTIKVTERGTDVGIANAKDWSKAVNQALDQAEARP